MIKLNGPTSLNDVTKAVHKGIKRLIKITFHFQTIMFARLLNIF